MITEDYISFEIAKLLKEKGFDERLCNTCYKYNGKFCNNRKSMSGINTMISYQAPTTQTVVKWFRNIHHIDICVCRELDEYGKCFKGYIAVIYKDDYYKVTIREATKDLTYEEATNKAIEYGLTLI